MQPLPTSGLRSVLLIILTLLALDAKSSEPLQTPSLTINDITVTEGNTGSANAVFPVNLSVPSSQTVTVRFDTADGSAKAGSDYAANSGTLTFNPGETTKNISIVVNGDAMAEQDEFFLVLLSNPVNAAIADGRGMCTIPNDDGVLISINDVTVAEGDTGPANAVFPVKLSAPSSQTVTVSFTTESEKGSATAGSDYMASSGTLTFNPGETTKNISIVVNGDAMAEQDEFFVVTLLNPSMNAAIADGRGMCTIPNDDGVLISINDVTVAEGDTGPANAVFPVKLSAPSSQTVTVSFTTESEKGSATAGSDYMASSGTLTFNPGETTKNISIVVNGDAMAEQDEFFVVTLLNPSMNAAIADGRGMCTIPNDDGVLISINDVTVAEGDTGPANAVFPVKLSAPSSQTVTVSFTTESEKGSATAGSDYMASSGTLTFNPGETTKNISIVVNGDAMAEQDEFFVVTLLNPSMNAAIADGRGMCTILNDDSALSINDITVTEGDTGVINAVFIVTLSPTSNQTVTIDFTTVSETAEAGSDYIAKFGILTFNPGEQVKNIAVMVNADAMAEPDETFSINLSNPMNTAIADDQGMCTIMNDDGVLISINDVTVAEEDTGTTSAVFTVTLSSSINQTVKVNFDTVDGTAKAKSDYQFKSGVLTFFSGTTSQSITIPIIDDTINEPNETFSINLSNSTNSTIGKGQGTCTITDDDAAGAVQFSAASYSVKEGESTAAISVTRSNGDASGVSVNYVAAAGTATEGSDYTAASGVISFGAGEMNKTFTIQINDDDLAEPDETVNLMLVNPGGGGVLSNQSTAVLTIVDNEVKVNPTINSFLPTSGPARTSVLITGNGFTDATAVQFNGVNAADFSAGSDTTIRAVVPMGATTGPISLTAPGGIATTSPGVFTVTADSPNSPSITGFTPISGSIGTNVTILGRNFIGATSVVFSRNVMVQPANFTVSSDGGTITVKVPQGADTGPISIVTPLGAAVSSGLFTVTTETRGFVLLTTPIEQTVSPGGSAKFAVNVQPVGAFSDSISLSAAIIPPTEGVSASFSTNALKPGGSATLTISTTAGLPDSSFVVTVVGISGEIVRSQALRLNVESKDFELSVAQNARAIKPGESANFEIEARAIGSFSEAINLSAAISPSSSAITAMLSSNVVMGNGKATLTVSTAADAPADVFTITVTGTAGGIVRVARLTVSVNRDAKDFLLSITPELQTISPGDSATYAIRVQAIGDFSETVILTSAGADSKVITANFSASSARPGESVVLTVTTSINAPALDFSITVIGVSTGGIVRAKPLTLTVKNRGFSFILIPSSQSIKAGDRTSFMLNTQAIGNFNESIALFNSSPPDGNVVLNIDPKVVKPGETAVLSVETTSNAAANFFTIAVFGTAGQLMSSTTATLEVISPDFSITFPQPQITLSRGQKGQFTVNVSRTGGFAGNVTVTPDAAQAKALKIKITQPSQSTAGASVSFDFKVKSKAPLGSQQLIFTGRDEQGRMRVGTLMLLIQ